MARNARGDKAEKAGKGKSRLFDDLSIAQVAAGALAAVTSMLLASQIGIYGSVIGVGVGSVVSAVASQLYKKFLQGLGREIQELKRAETGHLGGSRSGRLRYGRYCKKRIRRRREVCRRQRLDVFRQGRHSPHPAARRRRDPKPLSLASDAEVRRARARRAHKRRSSEALSSWLSYRRFWLWELRRSSWTSPRRAKASAQSQRRSLARSRTIGGRQGTRLLRTIRPTRGIPPTAPSRTTRLRAMPDRATPRRARRALRKIRAVPKTRDRTELTEDPKTADPARTRADSRMGLVRVGYGLKAGLRFRFRFGIRLRFLIGRLVRLGLQAGIASGRRIRLRRQRSFIMPKVLGYDVARE